ncbi:hypothetical protein AAHS21_30130 [Mycobacterium sp. 050272]|uniref:hypothetical protein n=1 Tax=Mycobacterium sp. 050272 TaxID=3142488 RepID=UPI003192FE6C
MAILCIAVRYQSAVDDGLDEDPVCSLERPADADNLSAAERSALRFSELFATNHLAIDDAVYDELQLSFARVLAPPIVQAGCSITSQ